jgi:hypothetical protein
LWVSFKDILVNDPLLVRAEIYRAEPSRKRSEPHRAKLGHFNFQAETQLTYFQS